MALGSHQMATTVLEKTMNPRSYLRWKPTGRIFSNVHLRWIPTGKLLNSCMGKVDSEPTHVSIVDIPHIHASKQTLDLSAGLVPQGQKASDYNNSDLVLPRQNVVPTAEKIVSSQQGLEFLFSPLLEERQMADHAWIEAMQDETSSVRQTKSLGTRSQNHLARMVIELKWLGRNKKGLRSDCIRNKARLVAKALMLRKRVLNAKNHLHPVARLEAVRFFVAHARTQGLVDQIIRKSLPSKDNALYGFFFNKQAQEPDADQAGCTLILGKHFWWDLQFLGDKLVRWMSKNKTAIADVLQQRSEYCAFSAKLFSSNVEEDTASRLCFNTTKYRCNATLSQPKQFHASCTSFCRSMLSCLSEGIVLLQEPVF
ncbi:hypothetical protein Tco_0045787 [Tanacetum coccineum]